MEKQFGRGGVYFLKIKTEHILEICLEWSEVFIPKWTPSKSTICKLTSSPTILLTSQESSLTSRGPSSSQVGDSSHESGTVLITSYQSSRGPSLARVGTAALRSREPFPTSQGPSPSWGIGDRLPHGDCPSHESGTVSLTRSRGRSP